MILSASRRTDIPAFYTQWFMDSIHKGTVTVKNPFNPHQIKQIMLTPDKVDAIIFWTRNPLPLIKYLHQLDSLEYRYIFLFTITGYPTWLETRAIPLPQTLSTFIQLSRQIGAQKVVWRYDPIVFSKELDFNFHIQNFSQIAHTLTGYTQRVIISIMQPYTKVVKRINTYLHNRRITLNPLEAFSFDTLQQFFTTLSSIAGECNMSIQSCCSNLIPYGIPNGACIDQQLLCDTFTITLQYPKDTHQRSGCLCAKSIDIGWYNSCNFGCVYCYASHYSKNTVIQK
ncbi:MAG: DUF1848 domain-containing protein [Spirochaetota bacterium]